MLERSFRLSETDYERLKEISAIEDVSVSQLIRMALKRFIAEYEDVDLMEILLNK